VGAADRCQVIAAIAGIRPRPARCASGRSRRFSELAKAREESFPGTAANGGLRSTYKVVRRSTGSCQADMDETSG
jgi:hypothetical protein